LTTGQHRSAGIAWLAPLQRVVLLIAYIVFVNAVFGVSTNQAILLIV
jgi:hypothetical protein